MPRWILFNKRAAQKKQLISLLFTYDKLLCCVIIVFLTVMFGYINWVYCATGVLYSGFVFGANVMLKLVFFRDGQVYETW